MNTTTERFTVTRAPDGSWNVRDNKYASIVSRHLYGHLAVEYAERLNEDNKEGRIR